VNKAAAAARTSPAVIVRALGLQDYEPLWRAMQRFTEERQPATPDEIWFTEHPPVFTLGMNANAEHLLAPGDIPVVQIDRGGQVTYHGPGQLMIYPLIDLRRASLGVRDLVTALEQSAIATAAEFGLRANSRADAPGVYVAAKKIASVGLRVRRGASFHGMAFNVTMDLEPFSRINPCGFSDLQVTDLSSLGVKASLAEVREHMSSQLQRHLWGGSPVRSD
jgi:lipoyl(octanoyl) transferase